MIEKRDSSTHINGEVSKSPIVSGDIQGDFIINYGTQHPQSAEKEGKGQSRSDQEIRDNIKKYIDFVKEETGSSRNVLGKSKKLNDYYVEQDGLFIAKGGSKVWTNDDSYFNNLPPHEDDNYKGKIKEIVESKLLEQKDLLYLLVGASFGVGTSTLAKWLAYEYANAYSVDNIPGKDHVPTTHYENDLNCIPIIRSLRKGSALKGAIYRQRELDRLLKEIIAPSLKLKPAGILLILDGINQLDSKEIIELKEEIEKMRDDYASLKVLLLSKPMVFPEEVSDLMDRFVRLLPFNDKQAQEYYFGKVRRLQGFDYNQLKLTYGEAVTKPLFASMIFLIHERDTIASPQTLRLMDERSEMKRIALVYMYFLAIISEAQYGSISDADNFNRRNWFRIIRAVAAFSHIHKDKNIEYDEISRMLADEKMYNPSQDKPLEDILDPIIVIRDGSVRFVHESFREYLLATFYMEGLLSYSQQENQIDDDDNLVRSGSSDIENLNRKKKYLNQYNLNIGIPDNSQPIDFLEGLLEILLDEENIGKFVREHRIDLRDSFGYDRLTSPEIKTRLKDNTLAILRDPYRVILVLKDALDHNRWVRRWYDEERENIKKSQLAKPFKFGNIWIHLWISLFISNKLSYTPSELCHLEIGKFDNLDQIMVISSNVIPSFLKRLRGIDLSCMELSGINLDGADLSYADIRRAKLRGANLCDTQLVEAKLIGTDLSNAKLCNAFMLGADLSGATLLRADLSGIKLTPKDEKSEYKRADFSDTNLGDANISDAKMKRVKLTDADLCRANLCDCDLSESILERTKLTFANLSYAILHDADIREPNLSYANLSEADLAGVDFSSCFSDSTKDNFINVNLSNAKIYEAKPIDKLWNYQSNPPINEWLVKTFPGDNEQEIPISSYIIACFSKSIKDTKYHFRVSKSKIDNDGPQHVTSIEGKISESKDGETIAFKPLCPLDDSSTYEVVIEDSEANNLAKWSFTTSLREKDTHIDSAGITAAIAKKEIPNVKTKRGISHDGNLFDRTLDSEFTTRWSNYGPGSWIIYDLGEPRNISAIDIGWFKGDKRIYYFEIKYSMSDKDDNNYHSTAPSAFQSKGKTLSPERYTFDKVRAQYVKIIVNGNSHNNWASITEVAFYECADSFSS